MSIRIFTSRIMDGPPVYHPSEFLHNFEQIFLIFLENFEVLRKIKTHPYFWTEILMKYKLNLFNKNIKYTKQKKQYL